MFEVEEDDACDDGGSGGPSGKDDVCNEEESDNDDEDEQEDSIQDNRINDASREQLIDSVQDIIQSTKREAEPTDPQAQIDALKQEVFDLQLCIEFIKEYGFLPNKPPADLIHERAKLNVQIKQKEKQIEKKSDDVKRDHAG